MVYVDRLHKTARTEVWKWSHGCHMVADTAKELHAMAKKLGLQKLWAIEKPFLHYFLTRSLRDGATFPDGTVRVGAIELGAKSVRSVLDVLKQHGVKVRKSQITNVPKPSEAQLQVAEKKAEKKRKLSLKLAEKRRKHKAKEKPVKAAKPEKPQAKPVEMSDFYAKV